MKEFIRDTMAYLGARETRPLWVVAILYALFVGVSTYLLLGVV